MSEQRYVSSDTAVLTGYVTVLRSPIEGEVRELEQRVGAHVGGGALMARVVNERVDEQHLEELRQTYAAGTSAAAGGEAERAALLRERDELMQRSAAHTRAVVERLAGQVAETQRRVAAREAAWQQAATQLQRVDALRRDGIVSLAENERAVAAERISREELAGDRQALQTMQGEERTARRGLLSEPGVNNDVAYSRQRVDEIELRLAATERTIAQSRSQAEAVASILAGEERRDALMRDAELRVPSAADGGQHMVWRLDASSGEHVAAGDAVAELVDCRASLLLVAIPQDRVPDLLMGPGALARLSGAQEVRTGQVVSVLGDPVPGENRALAATPYKSSQERMATVAVHLDPAPASQSCDVGRAASVRLPTGHSVPLARWARRYL